MASRQNSIPYLEELAVHVVNQERLREVQASIDAQGFWEEFVEWRISTVTMLRIERVRKRVLNEDADWYRVRVHCDMEMTCECPTVERAVEYLGVFERLIADLFWTLGWPSWAAYGRLKP